MNRITQSLIGIVAVILAGAAGIYGRSRYLQDVSTYPVPVPIQAIAPYTLLSVDQFQLKDMPRTFASLPYYQSLDELASKISTMPIPAGLPVPLGSAVQVSDFRLADPALEVISIPVEPVSSVGGQIRIGERINLYRVGEETTTMTSSEKLTLPKSEFQVETIASSILVVDVRTSQGVAAEPGLQAEGDSAFGSSSQIEQVQVLTLAVPPDLVETILESVAQSKNQGALLWTTLALP